jgi:hypothetical protein
MQDSVAELAKRYRDELANGRQLEALIALAMRQHERVLYGVGGKAPGRFAALLGEPFVSGELLRRLDTLSLACLGASCRTLRRLLRGALDRRKPPPKKPWIPDPWRGLPPPRIQITIPNIHAGFNWSWTGILHVYRPIVAMPPERAVPWRPVADARGVWSRREAPPLLRALRELEDELAVVRHGCKEAKAAWKRAKRQRDRAKDCCTKRPADRAPNLRVERKHKWK